MKHCLKSKLSKLVVLLAAAAGISCAFGADSIGELSETANSDLKAALNELTELRSKVESERVALGEKLSSLEQAVLDERAKLQRLQREEGNQMVLLGLLRTEVAGLSNEVRSIESLLSEYRRTFETRINISEQQVFGEAIKTAAAAADSIEMPPAQKLARQMDFLMVTLERLEQAAGGRSFDGQALTPAGIVEQGRFILIGPAAYFCASTGQTCGVVEQRLNSPEPNVAVLDGPQAAMLRTLGSSGTGNLPLDPTLGNAIRIRATRDSLRVHIAKGGPVMVPILLLGGVSALLFGLKWMQIAKVRVATPMNLRMILDSIESGHRRKAIEYARQITGPVGEMLDAAINHADEPKEYIEEIMYEKMLATKPRLERFVPFLALAAAAAPLLGLLGTVTGMINTFNMITIFGTGDPKTLAGGISEALITTEFGLVVAIPSLLLHALISRKVKSVLASMEQTTVAFINGLPSSVSEENRELQRNS